MEPNWMIPLERDVLEAAIRLGRSSLRGIARSSGYSMRETRTAICWLRARGMVEGRCPDIEVTESAKIVFAIMLGKRSRALAKKRGEENAETVHHPRKARQSAHPG